MLNQTIQPSSKFSQEKPKETVDYLFEIWDLQCEIFHLRMKIARLEASNMLQDARVEALKISIN